MTAVVRSATWPWVQYARPLPGARIVLVCLPHAGGAASAYREWPQALAPHGIEVWPVQLPGRESRLREPVETDLARLTVRLAEALGPPLAGRPWAVFGHSAGAYVAHVLARHLPPPEHVFLSASRPPGRPDPDFPLHRLSRDRLLERMRGYGGLPAQAWSSPELVDLALRTVRADLRLVETAPWPDGPPLDCAVTAVGGADDAAVPLDVLPDWGVVTAGRFAVSIVPGGHFRPPEAERRMMEVIRDVLVG